MLREVGPQPVALDEADALDVADETRLDLRTSRDQEVDSRRRAIVAKDALRMGLDLVNFNSIDALASFIDYPFAA